MLSLVGHEYYSFHDYTRAKANDPFCIDLT
jgi:hypothetical protein